MLLAGTYMVSFRDIELPLVRMINAEEREYFYGRESVVQDVKKVSSFIGPEDSVATTSGVVPYLAARKEIFSLPEPLQYRSVDWVVISGRGNSWPLSTAERGNLVQELRDSDEYERVNTRRTNCAVSARQRAGVVYSVSMSESRFITFQQHVFDEGSLSVEDRQKLVHVLWDLMTAVKGIHYSITPCRPN